MLCVCVCVRRVGGDLSARAAFPRTETFHPWINCILVIVYRGWFDAIRLRKQYLIQGLKPQHIASESLHVAG